MVARGFLIVATADPSPLSLDADVCLLLPLPGVGLGVGHRACTSAELALRGICLCVVASIADHERRAEVRWGWVNCSTVLPLEGSRTREVEER